MTAALAQGRQRPPKNGALIWQGPSELNGEPIALVATGLLRPTMNRKTGPLVQTWIIPVDAEPNAAVKDGRDASVCGSCPQRPSVGGACYVHIPSGPQRIWFTLNKMGPTTGYPDLDPAWLAGRDVRWGAWGDPAAVPLQVYQDLMPGLNSWSGFTHQWRDLAANEWGFLMASVENEADAKEAWSRGWRTFRVRGPDELLLERGRMCPASDEAGHGLTCATCKQCDGNVNNPGRPSRAIVAHGFRKKRFDTWMGPQGSQR